jgi:hypothetical protein
VPALRPGGSRRAPRAWRHKAVDKVSALPGAGLVVPIQLITARLTIGAFFLKRAADPALALTVADVAPYALFGAAYFAISAGILVVRRRPI